MKFLVCLLILISSPAYAGNIQKWVDDEGNTNYGDIPPPSVHTQEISVDVAPSDPGRPLPRLEAGNSESSTTASDSPGSAKSESEPEREPEISDDQAQAICKQAHQEIKYLNNAKHRSRVRNPDGTSRNINAEERKARREQSKQDIEDYCK